MYLTEAIAFARLACGRIDDTIEMTDAEVKTIILPSVVRKFSNLIPRRGSYTIQMVPYQTLYDFPQGGANIIQILETSPVNDSPRFSILSPDFVVRNPFGVTDYSSHEAAAYAREMYEDVIPYSVVVVGDKLEIRPTPSTAAQMVIRTQEFWTFAADVDYDNIPRMYREGFNWLLTSALARHVAAEREKHPQLRVGSASMVMGTLREFSYEAEAEAKTTLAGSLGPSIMQV